MRIYIAHPTDMDYENEIYRPLKNDVFFSGHELIFPHEKSSSISNTREDYRNIDVAIAECSRPSTGVGIELGWLYDDKKPIYSFYKSGTKPSGAVFAVSKKVIEYKDARDFVEKVREIIAKI